MRIIILLFTILLAHLANAQDENIYYVHNDHNGAPLMMTDQNQRVVWKAHYAPFGQAKIEIEEVELPVRYKGQYYDKESGLLHNNYRDYNSSTGRYVQSDPIGILRDYSDPQLQVAIKMGIPLNQGGASNGLNYPYAFANNNPVMYSDPHGLNPLLLGRAALTPLLQLGIEALGIGGAMAMKEAASDDESQSDAKPQQCPENEDDSCEELYQSTLRTCASLTGKKKFRCFEAARINREQCYQERGI